MANNDIQHFDLPFRFLLGPQPHAATVVQDTIDDVANCIEVAFLVEPGFRVEVPTFGVPEEVFELAPLPLQTLIDAATLWEKRANLLMTQRIDTSDTIADRVTAVVALRSAIGGGGSG